MKAPYKKPKNWNMDDFYKLASLVNISKSAFRRDYYKITKIYLAKMPQYIQKVQAFEKSYPLPMQQTRTSTNSVSFSKRLQSMFDNKIIQLKKNGIIKELELVTEAGGLLGAERKIR
jgi:hypothetical protein